MVRSCNEIFLWLVWNNLWRLDMVAKKGQHGRDNFTLIEPKKSDNSGKHRLVKYCSEVYNFYKSDTFGGYFSETVNYRTTLWAHYKNNHQSIPFFLKKGF